MAAGDFKWDSAKDGCCRMGLQSASLEHINCEHIIRQRCSFLCEAHSVKRVLPQFPHTWHVISLLHCVLLKCTFWFEVKIPVSTKHLSPEEKNKQTLMKLRTPDLDTAKPMAPAVTPPAEQFCALSLLKGTTLRRKSKSYKLVPFCVTGAANKAF